MDVHLCNRKLWEPSLLAQNIIRNLNDFVFGAANCDKDLAKQTTRNL